MLSSTLLPVLASAATVSAAKTYLAYAWNETAPEIHGMALQARLGSFYLGGQSFPACAEDDFDCAVQNKTLLVGPTTSKYSDNNDGFFLHIRDSQPQEMVTISSGELLYTFPKTDLAHAKTETYGSINTPFSVDHDDFSNQMVLRFNGNDWVSCPNVHDFSDYGYQPRQVRALSYGDVVYKDDLGCTPFKLRLEETDLPAPQYYVYPCTQYQGTVSGQAGHITCPDAMVGTCLDQDNCTDAQKKTWAIKTSIAQLNPGEPCQCRYFTWDSGEYPPGLGTW